MKYLIYVLLLFSVSCVSLKPAKDKEGGEKKIKKFNQGIMNQIERFPSLVDKAFTHTEYDTIRIPSDSVIINSRVQDKEALDSLYTKFKEASKDLAFSDFQLEAETKYSQRRLDIAKEKLDKYKQRIDSLFGKYREVATLINQVGTARDGDLVVDYKFINGELSIKAKSLPKDIAYEKTKTTNDILIKDKFYQDPKFWLGLAIALALLYFIGDKVTELWRTFINSIISFIKRLIFKI